MRTLIFLFFIVYTPVNGQKSIHHLWTTELQKYVDDQGIVNYAEWKKDTYGLDTYLKSLEENPPLAIWSKNDSLAYFINLYNAVTVKLILDNYPIKSIKNLITPWRFKRFNLGNKKVSLNHIEHDILRKMNEARIHFAINCASVSCPKLINKAFYSYSIGKQLEKATKEFINDPTRNKISPKSLELSKIFSWFGEDFGNKKERLEFIRKYAQIKWKGSPKIRYLDYDWALNE